MVLIQWSRGTKSFVKTSRLVVLKLTLLRLKGIFGRVCGNSKSQERLSTSYGSHAPTHCLQRKIWGRELSYKKMCAISAQTILKMSSTRCGVVLRFSRCGKEGLASWLTHRVKKVHFWTWFTQCRKIISCSLCLQSRHGPYGTTETRHDSNMPQYLWTE